MKKLVSFIWQSTAACHRLSKLPHFSTNYYFAHIRKASLCTVAPETANKRKIVFKTNTEFLPKKCDNTEKLVRAVVQQLNFDEQTFREMIHDQPEISTFDPGLVISNLTQLLQLGFIHNDIRLITTRYPHILTYQKNDIFDTFETWRKCHLFEKFLWDLFVHHPKLFAVSNDEVEIRLNRILYLMFNKINRVTSLLSKNPDIMFCPWKEVEEKFEYLYKTWRVLEKDISKSKALSLPMAHIKLRFTCLERCGEYIRPKKKESEGFDPRKNPSLSAIVDTSDDVFAKNVAKISLEEYEVFKKLMCYEEQQEIEDPIERYENEAGESEFDND